MKLRGPATAVLLVVLLGLTGCFHGDGGGDSGSIAGQEIVFWTAEDNAERVKATQEIIDAFTAQTQVNVKLVAIAEDQLQAQITAASAAGDLPDVFGAISLGFVHSLANDEIIDSAAAGEVLDSLGRDTFSQRALELVEADGNPAAVPSDAWTQLLVYRTDLFEEAGLAPPETFDALLAAARKLTQGGTAGIVAATKPGDSFTQQTFEHFALANGCQITDDSGEVTLTSPECVETFQAYTDLIQDGSVSGGQDADTTRATYFAGKAAMILWSSFLLDELAALRNDALPTCPECKADPLFLAMNSGIVTALQGPSGTEPAQFGEIVSFAITEGGKTEAAKAFVEYMMSEGYVDWLALAPEGKFPTRKGTADNASEYTEAWAQLDVGVDKKQPLGAIYPEAAISVLTSSPDTLGRWGFPQGQGALVGPVLVELPVPDALAASIEGSTDPQGAAERAQADVEEIKASIE